VRAGSGAEVGIPTGAGESVVIWIHSKSLGADSAADDAAVIPRR
jgi:hypothetical protein